jgi:hypothetical protein
MIAAMSESTRGESPVSAKTPLVLQTQSRWIGPAALVVAVIAVALAIWSLLASRTSTHAPTSQQIADAKGRACTAYNVVYTAVQLQTHADLGTDPVAVQAVAANARLSMTAGGPYLLAHLDPAAPADLAAATRSFANDLQDISMYAQAGVTNTDPAQAARLHAAEAASMRLADLCK